MGASFFSKIVTVEEEEEEGVVGTTGTQEGQQQQQQQQQQQEIAVDNSDQNNNHTNEATRNGAEQERVVNDGNSIDDNCNGGPQRQRQERHGSRQRRMELKIWDTAGQERYHSLTPLYIRGAGAAVLVYDICRLHSFQTVVQWVQKLRQREENIVLCVVGNKADLAKDRSVREKDARHYASSVGALYAETSARDDLNVQQVFAALAARLAREIPEEQPPEGGGSTCGTLQLGLGEETTTTAASSCCY